MEFFTIGVFNSTREIFFGKLKKYRVDTFCDIRRRRGVRGKQYAFVNSKRLQSRLHEMGIIYHHILSLSPGDAVREKQRIADNLKNETNRQRQLLDKEFVSAYKKQVLNTFDFTGFMDRLKQDGSDRIVFFCVEENPVACHRSLVAGYLNSKFGIPVIEL